MVYSFLQNNECCHPHNYTNKDSIIYNFRTVILEEIELLLLKFRVIELEGSELNATIQIIKTFQ